MIMKHRAWLATAALTLLGACGGGYDDTFNSVDVAAAWRNTLGANADFTLTGVGSDGNNYTLALALFPATFAAYPLTGEVGARGVQTATLLRNAISLGTTTTTRFHDTAPGPLIGSSVAGGECATVTAHAVLPNAAAIGSSGVLYDATRFSDCQPGAVVVGSILADWSLALEGGIVLFCVLTVQRDALAITVASESNCIAVDPAGTLGPYARVSTAVPGGLSLTVRNYN